MSPPKKGVLEIGSIVPVSKTLRIVFNAKRGKGGEGKDKKSKEREERGSATGGRIEDKKMQSGLTGQEVTKRKRKARGKEGG